MAFSTRKELPQDAVMMNKMEATTYAWDVVNNWNSLSETWALRYSSVVLGGINAVCGVFINKHYRTKLRLGTYGHLSSLIPIVVLSGSFTTLFHRHTVTTDMIIMKLETCPMCYEMRSAAIQCGFGVVYPMVLAPLSALMFANRYSTYRVPSAIDNPKELFMFMKKITKPLSGTLVYMMAFQFAISSFFTYYELKNSLSIRTKLREIEEKLDSGGFDE